MGGLAIRTLDGVGRSRGPAFLPTDLVPQPQGGLYQGLYKRLRGFILDGVWPPGTRLPSSRALAADLRVSRNTAILAVDQLIADGWAESRSRSGVYVAAAPSLVRPLPHRQPSQAAAELPPFALRRPATDLFPAQAWKQLQARAWAEIEPQRLATADPAGDEGLRDAIARLICAPRGLRCHADQILIVPTATAAIDLVAAVLLRPGDAALVEDPCRPATRRLIEARGARLHAAPLQSDGAATHFLEGRRDIRLACVAPIVQFPACTMLSEAGRARLLEQVRTSDGWVVEDDRDAELWAGDAVPPPLAAADGERVLMVGSFNRILFPGLCVAFLVAPLRLIERLRTTHAMIGGRASLASQLALREFIAEGHFARHVRRRRQAYGERRTTLCEALQEAGIAPPDAGGAGLHLVLKVRPGAATGLADRLAAARLGGAALDSFAMRQDGDDRLLLGLGASPDAIRSEAPRLATEILDTITHAKDER